MARYKLTLAYDGAAFSGSQRQARPRTVQSELERALGTLGWTDSRIALAGRTDAGVHAEGQVAAIDLDWPHSPEKLRDALNAKLPADLAVRAAELAGDRFHPRFDAVTRTYRYQVRCDPIRDPVHDRFAWRLWPPPREDLLIEVAELLLGTHDFGAFGSPARNGGSTIREVKASEWKFHDPEWRFEIAADGFLYRMVRRIIYVQIAVAQGRCLMSAVVRAMRPEDRGADLPAGLAPANGLILVRVAY